jgi:hypothetical protein
MQNETCDINITINAQQVEREREFKKAVYVVSKSDEATVSMQMNE